MPFGPTPGGVGARSRAIPARYLNVTSVEEAVGIVTRYFDEDQIPAKTRFALGDLLPG